MNRIAPGGEGYYGHSFFIGWNILAANFPRFFSIGSPHMSDLLSHWRSLRSRRSQQNLTILFTYNESDSLVVLY